jgi:hypothetical protein
LRVLLTAALLLIAIGQLGCCAMALADELFVRNAGKNVGIDTVYQFDRPVTGRGAVDIEWTDVLGRLVDKREMRIDLSGAKQFRFSLDPSRAVTIKNKLEVRVLLRRKSRSPAAERRANTVFYVRPKADPWTDYQIIAWQPQTRAGYMALKQIGVTAGMVMSDRRDVPGQEVLGQVGDLLDLDLGWYLENAATDFYAAYHRWFPGRPVNWRFEDLKQRYRADPQSLAAFVRDPSLSDPAWLAKITARLNTNVRLLRAYRPLFYSLGDETGIADLAAFWDFDLSPASLREMRQWLRVRYGDLASLNQEWGTFFRSWDAVVPMTTNEAIGRADQNFAAWGDFKEWMDVSFARALKRGTEAIHAADPKARSAIEGGQIPGWGGYDYSRLATSVDVIELGDEAENVEMLRSFNPKNIMLTTSYTGGAGEEHRVWRELLRGTRGLILWDDQEQLLDKNGLIEKRGREMARYLGKLRNGIGALLMNSRRHEDPIAILYSPISMKIQWLLDRIRAGDDWTRRSAETEYEDDAVRVSIRNYARTIEHLGLQHRFVSAEQVSNGELKRGRYRVLILPGVIALSDRAAVKIRDFVRQGGTAIADGLPGTFDEHGRRRSTAVLGKIFPGEPVDTRTATRFGKGQAISLTAPRAGDAEARKHLQAILSSAGISSIFSLRKPDGGAVDDVESYIFEQGSVRIIALLRDLKAGEAEKEAEYLELSLPEAYEIYNVREPGLPKRTARLPIKLDAASPTILALSQGTLPSPRIAGPVAVHAGEKAIFRIGCNGEAGRCPGFLHMKITDPDGLPVPYYGGNLPEATRSYCLPVALNDKRGVWTIHARNSLSGEDATAQLVVTP